MSALKRRDPAGSPPAVPGELRLADRGAADEAGRGGAAGITRDGPVDSISAWLDVLVRLLRLPEAERESVREELGAHLTERVRDLMVTGLTEAEASNRAIGELGDMAGLAQRFNRAGRPATRRRLMNFGLLTMAGVALVAGTLTLTRPAGPPLGVTVFDPAAAREAAEIVDRKLTVPPNANWSQFFEAAGKAAGLPVVVHWRRLSGLGGETGPAIEPTAASIVTGEIRLDDALAMINEAMGVDPDDGVAYRVIDGQLMFSSGEHLDKRETILATYDLSGIVEARLRDPDPVERAFVQKQVAEEVSRLIQSLVHADAWRDNGGDRAGLAVFDSKLFITAPKRFHPKIQWVLGELPGYVRTPAEAEQRRDAMVRSAERRLAVIREQLDVIAQERQRIAGLQAQGVVPHEEASRRIADLNTKEAKLKDEMESREAWLKAQQSGTGRVEATPVESSTRRYGLRHVTAASAAQVLNRTDAISSAAVARLVSDERTNTLIATCTADEHRKIAEVLILIDQPGGTSEPGPDEAAQAATTP